MRGKIFLIEDDDEIRECVSEFLQDEGFCVEVAQNGAAALANLSSSSDLPSLILLDLMMPVMDGLQFREEQLRQRRLRGIPTAMLSAHGRVEEKVKAVGGMNHVLKKPIELDDLLKLARAYCE